MSHFTPSRCLERISKDLDYSSSIQKRRLISYLSQDIFLNYASILQLVIFKNPRYMLVVIGKVQLVFVLCIFSSKAYEKSFIQGCRYLASMTRKTFKNVSCQRVRSILPQKLQLLATLHKITLLKKAIKCSILRKLSKNFNSFTLFLCHILRMMDRVT